jgi:hypothetical protein
MVDKLKEKLGSKDKGSDTKEETTKEETKEVTSTADLEFYNKYIAVSNKVQDAGEKVYKDYINDVPPKSITKALSLWRYRSSFPPIILKRVYKITARFLMAENFQAQHHLDEIRN